MLSKPKRVKNRKLLDKIKAGRCICQSGCYGKMTPSHITTVGNGGGDTPDNVVAMCMNHHSEWGTIGISRFCRKYPEFLKWLEAADRWDVIEKMKRLPF